MMIMDDSRGLLTNPDGLTGARAVARGVARMFLRHDIMEPAPGRSDGH